jgi:D-glycero-alpha-D-manno-heptose-7-phosphate kinase
VIISRTPFRISFFGGGTDYPAWYENNSGAVLGTTIDKYCYITCRCLPPFFEHKHRIVYSLIENVQDVEEIRHPSVRETLKFMKVNQGIEVHHDGDLPARSGMGSSSSFTVGFLNALYALKGHMPSKTQLAKEAIHIEQSILKENVGSQDQVFAAYGGLKRINFSHENGFEVQPVIIPPERLELFQKHLMLVFTGFSRTASNVAAEQIKKTSDNTQELTQMCEMVDEAINILNSERDIGEFGKLLYESWQLKRSLSSKITTPVIDFMIEKALEVGATGGKLLGAGGGGFILLFVKPELQPTVRKNLAGLLEVPFRFENQGSQILLVEPDMYSDKSRLEMHYV